MSVTIPRGDAGNLPLADASVDLIVTSPPYWALRSYTDGGEHYDGQIGSEPNPAAYIDGLIRCTAEWVRVLKPGGSIWVNLGDKYAQATERSRNGNGGALVGTNPLRTGPVYAGKKGNGVPQKSLILLPERYRIACVDQLGLIARAVVIWDKPNGLPESVTDRVRRSHEDWVHLVKQPRYFAAVDAIREQYSPNKPWGDRGNEKYLANSGRRDGGSLGQSERWTARAENPLGKLPGSVRTVATQPLKVPAELGIDHFAAFPMEWPRWIITGWCPEGGMVLDPFGGTGTTALVAHALGRHGISVDMSADYCRLARWRTTDPGQVAAAMQVEKPPKEHDGQLDLFGEKGAA